MFFMKYPLKLSYIFCPVSAYAFNFPVLSSALRNNSSRSLIILLDFACTIFNASFISFDFRLVVSTDIFPAVTLSNSSLFSASEICTVPWANAFSTFFNVSFEESIICCASSLSFFKSSIFALYVSTMRFSFSISLRRPRYLSSCNLRSAMYFSIIAS